MEDLEHSLQNVDINKENDKGFTQLHLAVINNDVKLVKCMINLGADVNLKTLVSENHTQIQCECTNIKYCFHIADEYGNEMRDGSVLGQSALHLAAIHGRIEILRLLLDSIKNVDEVADDGSTALHFATQNPDINVTELLLKYGANINARNDEGKTPLYLAVKFERIELVTYLLSMGANVNISTENQSTPLYSALINCNADLVQLLLNNKASTDVKNKYGEKPLFFVLRVIDKESRLRFVAQLLDNGVDVDSRNRHGSTVLHIAIQNKDEDLAKLLIDRGCPIDSKDCFDMSPLSIAVCTNLTGLAKLLLERGANVNDFVNRSSVLEHAVIRRNVEMVQLLLEHNADVNVGSERNKPVAAACLHKKTRIMQMLIDKGANINYKDKNGRTPLMRAIKEPNYAMMRHLLDHGASINEKDYSGNTAFHVLFENSSYSKENIIEYLINKGADVNIENNNGFTPFRFMMFTCFTNREVLIFFKHIALLLAQNLYVNPKITEHIRCSKTWGKDFYSCQLELELMKEVKILDKFSYFDVITKRCHALTPLFQAENILATFESGLCKNKFFHYFDILRRNFNRKSERLKLSKRSVYVLNDVFQAELPPEIVEKICEYLSNEDMKHYL